MKRLMAWLDHRTGYKKVVHEALYENVPGGSRWRYVWGSTLTFALVIQVITGISLWMSYSPSSQTAWESVYYIQYQMTGGWLLRGLHHFTAQLMTVLLLLHLMQVVIDGAYKAPREINFWFGCVLLILVLGLSLTGYLLPWDQKGYWATKVSTNIVGITPFIGPWLQRVIVGGADYGHLTLTRFFALHAGVLPATVIGFVALHVYLFRRHGLTPKQPLRKRDEAFWPDQVLKDAVACLAVLATVILLIVWPRLRHAGAPMGAELGGPADPGDQFSAARPEWYFLFLYQFLKYFPGESEIFGAIIIPSIAMGVIFLMPIIGRWRLGHRFNIGFLFVMLFGAGLLTVVAKYKDRHDADYLAAVKQADEAAERIKFLAASGIPREGALALVENDPATQGPKIFAKNCASCHRYAGTDGMAVVPKDAPAAADLKGFASREWLSGLLDPSQVSSPSYFGGTKFADGKMARFVRKTVAELPPAQKTDLRRVIAAISAEAQLPAQAEMEKQEQALIGEGRKLLASELMRCTECHQFHKLDEDATAPDLTGYGSREWLIQFVSDPAHGRFYGKRNDRMPRFGAEQVLTTRDIQLVCDWLRGDYKKEAEASASVAKK